MKYRNINTGDPIKIPAAAYNAMQGAAKAWEESQLGGPPLPGQILRQSGLVAIKNNSGSDISRFGILGIDGVVFEQTDNADGFYNAPILDGNTPNVLNHFDKIAVAQEPIANGKMGLALVNGVTPVQVDINLEGADTAGPLHGNSTMLEAAAGPARILYAAAGTGQKWAIVNLGGPVNQSPAKILTNPADGIKNDYLVVQMVDASGGYRHAGTNLNVAKPWKMRHNKDYYAADLTTLTTVDAQTVTVEHLTEDDETWKATPEYQGDDIIMIHRLLYTGVSSPSTMQWIAGNLAAQHWSIDCA